MALSISPNNLGSLVAGVVMNAVTFVAAGGNGPYVYSIDGPLPRGLKFDSATGVLSGKPEVPGDYGFLVLAKDTSVSVNPLDGVDASDGVIAVLVEGQIAEGGAFENGVSLVNGNGVAMIQENRTLVTVAPGKRLTVNVNGDQVVKLGGEQLYVPTFEVQYLRRDGVIE